MNVLKAFSLDGKTAVVTGARRGNGQAIAIGLAEAGASVIVVDRGDPMSSTALQLRSMERLAGAVSADLSDMSQVDTACESITSSCDVDILVNNAGLIWRAPAIDHQFEDWVRVHRINLDAVFRLCQGIGRTMIDRKAGKIINIASLLSYQGGMNTAAYTSSKHAVVGLTQLLSNEWGPHNVQVNAIAPGYIETDATRLLRDDATRERAIRERIPAGRWGTPADLKGAAVFLASAASDYVSGHTLVVDGGWLGR